jgi:N-acyl-D-aspartate/D-glutamate deacylase
MAELLIRNGRVVDGTGAPARHADILVRDGRIFAVGPSIAAKDAEVIDAEDAIVAPGFIDCHTHFDASLFWDPRCDPMPEHGVTTVLIGNCSLGLAPVTPGSRDEIADVFSFIEDIPRALFTSMVPWDWRTYGEFAGSLAERRFAVNVVGLVPHSWLRTFAMGADAWERAATPAEIAALAAHHESALKAGALGMSSSLFDKDSGGRRVPSTKADDAELDALFRVLGASGGIAQLIPRHPERADIKEDLERFGKFAGRYKVPVLVNDISDPVFNPDAHQQTLDWVNALQADGSPVYPMLSPRSVDIMINFHHTLSFMDLPAWNEVIAAASGDEKRAMLADPAWRARARDDWDNKPSMLFPTRRLEALRIVSVGEAEHLAHWISRGFTELVAERGGHPSDVLAGWVLETDLEGRLVYPITNQRPEVVGRLLREPAVMFGASDAGAHFQAFCGAGDTTLLLTRHVRERGDLTIEAAIRGLTGRQAELMGLRDRGLIRPGAVADLVIFKLEELEWRRDVMVRDVPGNVARLRRPWGGYRYTILGGEVVQAHGQPVDVLPGRFLGAGEQLRQRTGKGVVAA